MDADDAVRHAADLLARGEIVAHPTETVYGLAGCADVADAYGGLLRAKGGSTPRAFLILFDSRERFFARVGALPRDGEVLASAFWPGPLTLLFPAPAGLPAWWSGPEGDVAARVTPHAFCVGLIRQLGAPILSTSANLAGAPTCDSAAAVADAFAGRGVALVVDGGRLVGRPSTILRWTEEHGWTELRSGPVSFSDIERVLAHGTARGGAR